MGKQTAEKSKAYLLSKSRSNWEYITILSQQIKHSAESVAEATYANRIWQNSPAMRRLAEVSNFAPFFSQSWLDMRVQFRESEIWARCVIVEPGRLTALYLVGRYFLFAQICLYMKFSHVYLESLSLPFSFVQHLLKELLSIWKSEKKQIDLQVTSLFLRTRIKSISLLQSLSIRGNLDIKSGLLQMCACRSCSSEKFYLAKISVTFLSRKTSKISANQDLCRQALPH